MSPFLRVSFQGLLLRPRPVAPVTLGDYMAVRCLEGHPTPAAAVVHPTVAGTHVVPNAGEFLLRLDVPLHVRALHHLGTIDPGTIHLRGQNCRAQLAHRRQATEPSTHGFSSCRRQSLIPKTARRRTSCIGRPLMTFIQLLVLKSLR